MLDHKSYNVFVLVHAYSKRLYNYMYLRNISLYL